MSNGMNKFIDGARRLGGLELWGLMAANLLVFIGVNVAVWCGVSPLDVAQVTALPSLPAAALTAPWTLLTYMFTQWDFMHLLSNMLWLWLFGMMAVRLGITGRQLLAAYLVGGLVAGLIFVAAGALGFTKMLILIGSSSSVLSIVAMTGIMRGRYKVQLMLLGEMDVRWLSLVVIVLVMLTSSSLQDTGVVAAHAAGALAGVLMALYYMRRVPSAHDGFNYGRRNAVPRGSAYGPYPRRGLTPAEQAELDRLLDDVRRHGYAGISPAQRSRLFELSSHIK